MSLNGIDIASYQAGIDLGAVPCDFAIVKATEGTGYTNPCWRDQVNSALGAGRKLGLYHFASGLDATAEADYFVDRIGDYIGQAILVLDWEADAVNCGPAWARVWLDRVCVRTGVRPLIYMSNSVVNEWNWAGVAGDYPLWNAAYYAGYEPMSYNYDPPIYGGMGAWNGCTIYQYTSSGYIENWGSALDLNIFYGDRADWDELAGNSKPVDSGARAVQLFHSNGTGAQRWVIEHNDDGTISLRNIACGKYLDVCNGDGVSGQPIQVFPGNGTDAQRWTIVEKEGGYAPDFDRPQEIVPKVNDKLRLDVTGGGDKEGTHLQIWEQNNTPAQEWYVMDAGDGTVTIINNSQGAKLALDVVNGGN